MFLTCGMLFTGMNTMLNNDPSTHTKQPGHKKSCFLPAALVFAAAWLLLIALDLWTKALAQNSLCGKEPIELIPGALELYYLQNTGAAFSLLENAQWLFILIAAVVTALIGAALVRIPKTRRFLPLAVSLLFISSGAVGNLVDRIRLGYVRDFIYISLINFPVFNVADMYVTIATAALVLLVLFYYKDEDFAFLHARG